MINQQKNNILFRILSGIFKCTINNELYIVKSPSVDLIYDANELYTQKYLETSFTDDWLLQHEARNLLRACGLFDTNIYTTIDELYKRQDDLKLYMFKNYLDKDGVEKTRRQLNMTRKKTTELVTLKHSFDYITPDGYAAMCKSQFLLAKTTYFETGQRVWDGPVDNIDYLLLDSIMGEINDNYIEQSLLREFARNEPWRSYWSANKEAVFGKPVLEWTDDQRALVSYTKMYDNIYENSECPDDEIINDDDLLDGWLINLRKQRDAEKLRQQAENLVGEKHKNDTEIFLPAKNLEHATRINAMNPPEMKHIKEQRAKAIQQSGTIAEQNLPDVRLERLLKTNQ